MSALLSIGNIFASGVFDVDSKPDEAPNFYCKPAPNFVLCRDKTGKATAVYGDLVWDFNPYRLSATKIGRINFQSVFGVLGSDQQALIEEAKYILYCVIYFGGGGVIGSISASTLGQYWVQVLRRAMQFCYAQREKPMVGVISIKQLFTTPVYLEAFASEKGPNNQKVLSAFLGQLIRVGEPRLGYSALDPASLSVLRPEYKQCPVIPTRIYLSLINAIGDMIDHFYQGVDKLESLIGCFSDRYYGLTPAVQRLRGLESGDNYRPNMLGAIKDHELDMLFVGEFFCPSRIHLQRVLLKIQYILKIAVHLYTGMRDQEVMRMNYECLTAKVIREAVVDDFNVGRDRPEVISVLSTTTKYSGYKKAGSWFAPEDVVKAIEVARSICRGLAKLYGIDVEDKCPLFLNPSVISRANKLEVSVTGFKSKNTQLRRLNEIKIKSEDILELAETDPGRDFYNEKDFEIGKPWPLTSHQFRRSLAFYGSSSGFVSLPSLRAQYKHTTIQMARYYSNGFENIRTVFGYFDKEKGDFVMPSNHFAFEFQMAKPMSVVNQLVADLLAGEEEFFGGTGSFMQKQKERLVVGEIDIKDVRAETERRVKNGEINYRKTLLGGCTKFGRCDSFLLGDFTECLSCSGAIIKSAPLNSALERSERELAIYAEGSGEYQILKAEVDVLSAFKANFIDVERV